MKIDIYRHVLLNTENGTDLERISPECNKSSRPVKGNTPDGPEVKDNKSVPADPPKIPGDGKIESPSPISVEAWFNYAKPLDNISADAFNFDRAYVNYKTMIPGDGTVRVTTDVGRVIDKSIDPAGKSQQLIVYLKYAYIDYPVNILFPCTVKLGLQQTVWIDWMEGIWNNKNLAKVVTDTSGLMPSADLGVGILSLIHI